MKFFFAGTESTSRAEWIREVGAKNALESAFALRFKNKPNKIGFESFYLDSGGFTFRKKGESLEVRVYVDYINKFGVKQAFNLDTADIKESLENQRILEKYTSAQIIPVYHYSEWITDEHRYLIDQWLDYPLISIAAIAAPAPSERTRFYEFCFSRVTNRCKVHGLAATKIDDMLAFPFYSVDSTSWINAEKFGEWHQFENGRIIKYKSLRLEHKSGKNRMTNVNLVDFDRKRFFQASAKAYIEFEGYATRLWEQRGIKFDA